MRGGRGVRGGEGGGGERRAIREKRTNCLRSPPSISHLNRLSAKKSSLNENIRQPTVSFCFF